MQSQKTIFGAGCSSIDSAGAGELVDKIKKKNTIREDLIYQPESDFLPVFLVCSQMEMLSEIFKYVQLSGLQKSFTSKVFITILNFEHFCSKLQCYKIHVQIQGKSISLRKFEGSSEVLQRYPHGAI